MCGGILENAGMSIHRRFDVPGDPGSAAQGSRQAPGMVRVGAGRRALDSALHLALVFGYPTGEEELDGLLRRERADLFGEAGACPALGGCVALLPAYPLDSFRAGKDVVTCHHMKYYGGDKKYLEDSSGRALDNEQPNPQFFPVIEAGSRFLFQLVRLPRGVPAGLEAADAMELAAGWLARGLDEHGIGAKTAAGYGWMELDEAEIGRREVEAEKLAEQQRQQALEKARLEALSPQERENERVAKLVDNDFSALARSLPGEEESVQRAFLATLRTRKKWWKMKRKKAPGLAGQIRSVAEALGEELP